MDATLLNETARQAVSESDGISISSGDQFDERDDISENTDEFAAHVTKNKTRTVLIVTVGIVFTIAIGVAIAACVWISTAHKNDGDSTVETIGSYGTIILPVHNLMPAAFSQSVDCCLR